MNKRTVIILLLIAWGPMAYGHSGRTDSSGGHWNRKTGDYHYHSGSGAASSPVEIESKPQKVESKPVSRAPAAPQRSPVVITTLARTTYRSEARESYRESAPVRENQLNAIKNYHNLTPAESPDVEPYRTWTEKTGTFSVEARFISLKTGKVQLKRKSDGVVINVAVDLLSAADHEYLQELRRKHQ